MNEKSDSPKKFDRFEEWRPGEESRPVEKTIHEQHGPLFHSAGSSVPDTITANGGLKVGGLVKKVCDSFCKIATTTV